MKANKWINVKDKPPPSKGEFLAINEEKEMEVCWELWEKDYRFGDYECFDPTHWMPLPELPIE